MKFVLLIFLALAYVKLSTSANSTVTTCQRRVNNNCLPWGRVCFRNSNSNLCVRYRNICQKRFIGCSTLLTSYTRVNLSRCGGSAFTSRVTCSS